MGTMSRAFWEDKRWVYQNYTELTERYPDQWVAIVDKKVIAAGDLGEVKEKATRKIKRGDIVFMFIEGAPHVY